MQYGFQVINGKQMYFDKVSGAQAFGQKNINGKWYLFDNKGAMQTGFQRISNQNKTVYYNEKGQMQYGQQYLDGHWYLFDKATGAMKTGFQKIADQHKTVYYNQAGQMLYGQQYLNGKWYNFDKNSGAMKTGFQWIAEQAKTVYYNQAGQMLHGQQYVNGHWYLFDKATGAMQTGFQNLAAYGQNKTVYYNEKGQMQYGFQTIDGKRYYFNYSTGAKEDGLTGWKNENGHQVYYDPTTAKKVTGELRAIGGRVYAFNNQGYATDFAELAKVVNSVGTPMSIAIQSQKSGQIYHYSNRGGNYRFWTASTVKVAVLAELLHNTSGNLTSYQRRLAENMIKNSDNASTTTIANQFLEGRSNAAARLYRDLGMHNTTPGQSWGITLTTPEEQLKLLKEIYLTDNSRYLNKSSQNYIKSLMHSISPSQRWGISAGANDFYLKNGWLTHGNDYNNWVVNSIGFVPNHGQGYTIAIFSEGNALN
ncbi:MAG: hypothetical protein MJ139_06045, partial [Limosilactobacillus sp.]|nr:hypothetical protein [Limosilactobacillus sp.]